MDAGLKVVHKLRFQLVKKRILVQIYCLVQTPIQGAAAGLHWLSLAWLGVEVSTNSLKTTKSSHLGSHTLSILGWGCNC